MATRVLIVEDEMLIRFVAGEFLREEGFEVTEAGNASQAINILDTLPKFDVLFTDMNMPGTLDGLDVAIRAQQLHPDIGILITSGKPPSLDRMSLLDPPACFRGKPYMPQDVLNVIKAISRGIP